MMKQRIDYLDIAKGIAFLLVIFCHSVAFTDIQDGSCQLLHEIRYHSVWYAYFFMAVFFIVSGFFINTDKPWKTYLWKNFKMLVLGIIGIRFLDTLIRCTLTLNPSGMLEFVKNIFSESILMFWGTWFIGALFVARMLYFALSKVTDKDWILGILLVISAMGGYFGEIVRPEHSMASTGDVPLHIHLGWHVVETVRS